MATFGFLSLVAWEPAILDKRLSLDSVLLYLQGWSLKDRQNHFVSAIKTHWSHPMVFPLDVASPQCPDRLIFWKQCFGRLSTGKFLGNVQKRISYCSKSFACRSSFISVFGKQLPFLNQVLPQPLCGPEKVDTDRNHRCSPGSSPVRDHLASFLWQVALGVQRGLDFSRGFESRHIQGKTLSLCVLFSVKPPTS